MRIAVIVSAQLLLAAAVVITLTLPLDAAIRGGACLCCIALGRFELQRLRHGHSNCLEIRLTASGEALILNQEQEWSSARLETGSVLLRNFAWLRLRGADGRLYSELFRGNSRESQDWRRLQLIWRHIGAI